MMGSFIFWLSNIFDQASPNQKAQVWSCLRQMRLGRKTCAYDELFNFA